jgi:hypothetical protein
MAAMPLSVVWLSGFLDKTRPYFRELGASAAGSVTPPPSLAAERLLELIETLSAAMNDTGRRDQSVDVWSIVGLRRDEVTTARVLTWLLDPQGTHGMGDRYLQSLWLEVAGEHRLGFRVDNAKRADREVYVFSDTRNRVDIEVTGANFILLIEVKVDAVERTDQLADYANLARLKADNLRRSRGGGHIDWAVLYITVGRGGESAPNFLHLTWRDVARAIRRAERHRRPGFSGRLALSFACHVERFG